MVEQHLTQSASICHGLDAQQCSRYFEHDQWQFFHAANKASELPPVQGMEISFIGRSNVGKSTLVNALLGRNALARTSKTPGRTQSLIFFRAHSPLVLVDMPGYGYAKVSKSQVRSWERFSEAYLKGRPNLARVFLLIDSRHGIKPSDEEKFKLFDQTAVNYQIVLTKCDKVSRIAIKKVQDEVEAAMKLHVAAHPRILCTSAEKGEGMTEIKDEILSLMKQRGFLS